MSYLQLDRLIQAYCFAISKIENPLLAFIPQHPPSDIAFFFAAWRMGKALYPISFRHPRAAVEERLAKTGARFITLSTLQTSSLLSIESLDENALATLIETSSSGKIVCHTLKSHLASAASCAAALNLQIGDTYCLNLPLFHVSGIATMLRTFATGASLVLPNTPATHISMVPTQLYRLIEKNETLPNLKCLLVGGAPLSPSLYETALARNLPLYCSYGMTESASMALIKAPGGPITPLPHITCKLEDELLLKGDSMMLGYFGKEPLTGWFRTGDIANEQLEIIGRKDRQFISGGENIIPEEIEAALLQLPHVIEAKVEPEADPEFGMRPIAKIYSEKELSEATLKQALEGKLPRYKIPKKILISSAPFSSKQSSLTKIFI